MFDWYPGAPKCISATAVQLTSRVWLRPALVQSTEIGKRSVCLQHCQLLFGCHDRHIGMFDWHPGAPECTSAPTVQLTSRVWPRPALRCTDCCTSATNRNRH